MGSSSDSGRSGRLIGEGTPVRVTIGGILAIVLSVGASTYTLARTLEGIERRLESLEDRLGRLEDRR